MTSQKVRSERPEVQKWAARPTFLGFKVETLQLTNKSWRIFPGCIHMGSYLNPHFLSSSPQLFFSTLSIYLLSALVFKTKDNFLLPPLSPLDKLTVNHQPLISTRASSLKEPFIPLSFQPINILRSPSPAKIPLLWHILSPSQGLCSLHTH